MKSDSHQTPAGTQDVAGQPTSANAIIGLGNEIAGDDGAGIEPGLAERLQQSLNDGVQQQEMSGETPILLTSGILRSVLAKFVKYTIPSLRVISYQEIPDNKQIKIVSAIGQ